MKTIKIKWDDDNDNWLVQCQIDGRDEWKEPCPGWICLWQDAPRWKLEFMARDTMDWHSKTSTRIDDVSIEIVGE